ncbi:MAG: serine hydrolase [Acidobacteria bacterium]|nr:serine hydrolase [Acidobacteriota bacterium]
MTPPPDDTLDEIRLDAAASDPAALKWMVGAPPPSERLIRFGDSSFARFPRTRWSFAHMRQLMPTSVVPREDAPVVALPRRDRDDLEAVIFQTLGSRIRMTWAESLAANFTDGVLVLHRGHIVYERYFGVLTPHTQHIAFSVTKSFVATLAAVLIHEGVLDEHATIASYLPELADGGYADATIRQLLDMTAGIDYVEDYTDDTSSIWSLSRAGGFRPRPSGYSGPDTFYDYVQTLQKASGHGERFAYKTVNTDTLGWVLRRVTGRTVSELLRHYFWSRLGVEQDAYFTVDSTGVEFAGGGLNLTLRDMARFGEMMRLGGRVNGQQIVPAIVIDDISHGGNHDHFALAGYALLPGWSYRTMWWVTHNDHGAYTARGIHGQGIYVDPVAEMVIARFASHPLGANANLDPTSLPAYHALAQHLMAFDC